MHVDQQALQSQCRANPPGDGTNVLQKGCAWLMDDDGVAFAIAISPGMNWTNVSQVPGSRKQQQQLGNKLAASQSCSNSS